METTFMTIHDLSPDARILFASESILEILDYYPQDVVGRSCFDYFHPEEIPFARDVHKKGVLLDKAAVLHYARIRSRNGMWVGCECVFTIVHDVLVACTSIYRGDAKNERRAAEAPVIRRLFTSSPRDPRYHMLEHLSAKFRTPVRATPREPRAALILNRFTRTLTVMYATNAVSSILGVTPEQLKDKSFYECIQENCLPEAIRCLESAKANDSIAYLRFWYRNPRRPEDLDEEMADESPSSDSEDGGVELDSPMNMGPILPPITSTDSSKDISQESPIKLQPVTTIEPIEPIEPRPVANVMSSEENTDLERDSPNDIFDQAPSRSSSSSLLLVSPEERRRVRGANYPAPQRIAPPAQPFEIEAVVSCTSDGLVVVLRRARPMIPMIQPVSVPAFANGLFAAPWGVNPIRPYQVQQPNPRFPINHGFDTPPVPASGPPVDDFMNSIREVAVFAWSLAGINGNLAAYGRGTPSGEAQPPGGLPIWDPYAQPSPGFLPPRNQALDRWARMGEIDKRATDVHGHMQYGNQSQDIRFQGSYQPGRVGLTRHAFAPTAPQDGGGFMYQSNMNNNNQYASQPSNIQPQHLWNPAALPRTGINPSASQPSQEPHGPGPSQDGGGSRYLWY